MNCLEILYPNSRVFHCFINGFVSVGKIPFKHRLELRSINALSRAPIENWDSNYA